MIKLFRGKGREIHPMMYLISAAFFGCVALLGVASYVLKQRYQQ